MNPTDTARYNQYWDDVAKGIDTSSRVKLNQWDYRQVIERYGEPSEEFLAPKGTPYEQRALAPHSSEATDYQYEVKTFNIVEGETAPWFEQPGGGKQLYGVDQEVLK